MKSVLDIAGLFLYLASLFIIAPIMLFLYLLLTCWKSVMFIQALWLQVMLFSRHLVAATTRLLKQRWMPARKWQLNWHLHKAS